MKWISTIIAAARLSSDLPIVTVGTEMRAAVYNQPDASNLLSYSGPPYLLPDQATDRQIASHQLGTEEWRDKKRDLSY